MRSIRKLYLLNSAGRQGLNGENGVYATDLAGFGFSFDPSFADIGSGFFPSLNDGKSPQNTLAFTVVLTKNPYAMYQELMDWLAAAETLTIAYSPTDASEYRIDVAVSFVQKGELNQVGWLEIPCGFLCKTPWYQPTPTALNASGSGVDKSKRYPYKYNSTLRYGQNSTASIRAIVAGAGHIPGAMKITFRGSVANPRIKLTGNISGRVYGVCAISKVFSASDVLEVSTRYEDSYVQRILADGTREDLLDALDLSANPFFRIPVDESCLLSIEADSVISGHVALQIYYYYRSV